MINLPKVFEDFDDEFLKFDRIEDPLHERPDLCAFLLLSKLLPCAGRGIVGGAEHDEIYLNIDCEALARVATEDHIKTLARCGVLYDEETDSLKMFA